LIIFIGSVNLDRLAYLGKIKDFAEKVFVPLGKELALPFLSGVSLSGQISKSLRVHCYESIVHRQ
jgi:hypothetical protein